MYITGTIWQNIYINVWELVEAGAEDERWVPVVPGCNPCYPDVHTLYWGCLVAWLWTSCSNRIHPINFFTKENSLQEKKNELDRAQHSQIPENNLQASFLHSNKFTCFPRTSFLLDSANACHFFRVRLTFCSNSTWGSQTGWPWRATEVVGSPEARHDLRGLPRPSRLLASCLVFRQKVAQHS